MKPPPLDAFGDLELLGSGPNGAVFRGVKADGSVTAVKLLDGMSVNRRLLERACARLEQGGWPHGVLEVLEADFRARPAARVTPCLADPTGDGNWRPRSLQYQLDQFPGERSWSVVLGLIDAVAGLHNRRVAHGNLKPGNVFFDSDDRVVLADWALGNMPGVGHQDFTDACLYQPPEQLLSAEGYLEEEGYRWDVFAIGALAYRILTGSFPRCDRTFQQVAPLNGEMTRTELAADYPKIAESLQKETSIAWPDEPANELELRYREILDRCLALDPLDRPANAMEVCRLVRRAELAVQEEEKRDAVLDQHRRAQHSLWRVSIAAGILFAALVGMVFLWQLAQSRYDQEVASRKTEVDSLTARVADAETSRDVALESEEEAREALTTERATWLACLEESRQIGDRLFSWAMAKGHRSLPPLDGRELRLTRLENYYDRFLERTARVPELDDERARVLLQMAEIALAKGKPNDAARRFEVAVQTAEALDKGPELEFRLATDRLTLALLYQERNDSKTSEAFKAARRSLEQVPQSEVDGDRMAYLLAILDLNESRHLAMVGDEESALEMLHRATESLNLLSDTRPEAAILRSELVACYLSSAGILDGMGEMGDARALRKMAAGELLEMIEERPEDLNLRLELAGCYGSIAETALIAGDVGQAESMSNGAVKLLTEILPQRPDSVVTRSRLAAQRGLMAGILRDRGEGDKALELYDEGLRLLEGLTVGEDADPMARYRFALLTWEKGRMKGFSGDRAAEIAGEQRAVEILNELLETPYGVARGEQIRRSLGYLLGDLGHAAQLDGQDQLSSSAFTKAVKTWEDLNRERPGSEEYEEALAWNRQRLDDVR